MSDAQADDDIILELLPAFIDEANAQSEALEQLLLQLEAAPDDRELLDALFRCAHTIKGSAGVFGLARVVSFTHHVEALLDRLRDGLLALTPALSTLLLQSNDVIHRLVNTAREASPETPDEQQQREALVARLQAAAEPAPGPAAAAAATPAQAADAEALVRPSADGLNRFGVSVQFGDDTFRNGIDQLTLLNYVRGLGEMHDLVCDSPAVPELGQLDPERCHLGFRFELSMAGGRDDLERAFKFAREDCVLEIREAGAGSGSPDPAEGAVGVHETVNAVEASIPLAALEPGAEATPATSPQPDPAAATLTARPAARPRAAGSPAPAGEDGGFIRVHADRLDEVINLLGELVIAGAGASMLARQTQQRALVEANQQVTRLIEGIRNSTLKLRMVPIGETFARFRRVVRDTASELGKDVALEIEGGDTELDKALVERIADPLMHLVRNALDHGLETPAQRAAAGKPAQGHLTLSACHESGSILIRIIDDGRGVQRDKVLQRARERHLIEPDAVLSDDEVLNLIFAPGFSTAETVTALSGRGVGMDVVRSNVEALRGSVNFRSDAGQGSCIEIRLPLTLAIIDGFLVGVGSSKFILPLDAVVEVIANRERCTTVDASGRSCVELRGEVLPVVDLRSLYALDSPQPERCSVVVVRTGHRRFGVQVDSLLGQHQTVIKPLGLMLRSLRGVSGSSILGTGEVALIFDAPALGQLAAQPRRVIARTPIARAVSPTTPRTFS